MWWNKKNDISISVPIDVSSTISTTVADSNTLASYSQRSDGSLIYAFNKAVDMVHNPLNIELRLTIETVIRVVIVRGRYKGREYNKLVTVLTLSELTNEMVGVFAENIQEIIKELSKEAIPKDWKPTELKELLLVTEKAESPKEKVKEVLSKEDNNKQDSSLGSDRFARAFDSLAQQQFVAREEQRMMAGLAQAQGQQARTATAIRQQLASFNF